MSEVGKARVADGWRCLYADAMDADPPVPPESPADIARAASRPGFAVGAAVIYPVVAVALAYNLFVPSKPLPVRIGNGTYTNPCCASLMLQDGQARSADVTFRYVIEPGKQGPRVRVDKWDVVLDGGHLHLVKDRAGQFLFLAASDPPGWLDVDGVRFVRTATANAP